MRKTIELHDMEMTFSRHEQKLEEWLFQVSVVDAIQPHLPDHRTPLIVGVYLGYQAGDEKVRKAFNEPTWEAYLKGQDGVRAYQLQEIVDNWLRKHATKH